MIPDALNAIARFLFRLQLIVPKLRVAYWDGKRRRLRARHPEVF